MKNNNTWLIILVFVCLLAGVAQYNISFAVETKPENGFIIYDGKDLYKRSAGEGFIVFGKEKELENLKMPPGFVPQSYSTKKGEWRYHGMSELKIPFANDKFPPDANSGKDPGEKKWIRINLEAPHPLSPDTRPNSTYNNNTLYFVNQINKVVLLARKQYGDLVYEDFIKKLISIHTDFAPLKYYDLQEFLYVQALPIPGMGGSAIGWNESKNKDGNDSVFYQTFNTPIEKRVWELRTVHVDEDGKILDYGDKSTAFYTDGDVKYTVNGEERSYDGTYTTSVSSAVLGDGYYFKASKMKTGISEAYDDDELETVVDLTSGFDSNKTTYTGEYEDAMKYSIVVFQYSKTPSVSVSTQCITTTGSPISGAPNEMIIPPVEGQNYSFSAPTNLGGYKFKGSTVSTASAPKTPAEAAASYASGVSSQSLTYNSTLGSPVVYFVFEKTSSSADNYNDYSPDAWGEIKADNRGSEKFDVTDGIPVTEDLYVNGGGKRYLGEMSAEQREATKSYEVTVDVTYNLKWTETRTETVTVGDKTTTKTIRETKRDTEAVSKTYNIERKYKYWVVTNLRLFQPSKMIFTNASMPSTRTLSPSGMSSLNVDIWHSLTPTDHIVQDAPVSSVSLTKSVNGGSSRPSVPNDDFTSEAEGAVGQITVKSDRLIITEGLSSGGSKRTVIFNDNGMLGEAPGQLNPVPIASQIGKNVFYENGIRIPTSKTNRINGSSAKIEYKNVFNLTGSTGSVNDFSVSGVNDVIVHTPTVCYASLSDASAYNQMYSPASSRQALVLRRPFILTLPTSGSHRSIRGYGSKDYSKYIDKREVKIPFDVYRYDLSAYTTNAIYSKSLGEFIKANTWITLPNGTDQYGFFIPPWVDEGNYELEFRAIAINSPDSYGQSLNKSYGESEANTIRPNGSKHMAYDTINVEISGRVAGFRITDISDPIWREEFFNEGVHTGLLYPVGSTYIDGSPRGNDAYTRLPLGTGHHPKYKNLTLLPGYVFQFDLVTIGNMFGDDDRVQIKLRFYFVNEKGQYYKGSGAFGTVNERQAIDIYYHANGDYFIKVGDAARDTSNITIKVSDPDFPSTDVQVRETIRSRMRADGLVAGTQAWDKKGYGLYYKDTSIGGFSELVLHPDARNYIGDQKARDEGVSHISEDRYRKSIQRWFGKYYFPNNSFAVEQNFDVLDYGRTHGGLNGKEDFWLKDGYVVINFDVKTYPGGGENLAGKSPKLGYYGTANRNQWNAEGFDYSKPYFDAVTVDYTQNMSFKDGDVVLVKMDEKASDHIIVVPMY